MNHIINSSNEKNNITKIRSIVLVGDTYAFLFNWD